MRYVNVDKRTSHSGLAWADDGREESERVSEGGRSLTIGLCGRRIRCCGPYWERDGMKSHHHRRMIRPRDSGRWSAARETPRSFYRLKAVKVLAQADVGSCTTVSSARPCSPWRRKASRAFGRQGWAPFFRQEGDQRSSLSSLAQGLCVVRPRAAGSVHFRRGCEEIAALRAAGLSWPVVPGITAALRWPRAAGR